MGKTGSEAKFRFWQESDPTALTDKLFERFEDDASARNQYRRVIRFLKRWKDVNFTSGGHGAPRGVGLTINVHDYFDARYQDTTTYKLDDLTALRDTAETILGGFESKWVWAEWKYVKRLTATLLVSPFNDVHEKMTDKQMETFETKLTALRDALNDALDEVDTRKACEILHGVFGDDFDVPEKKDTAKPTPVPVTTHSQSA